MKTLFLTAVFAIMQLLNVLCTGTNRNGDQIKLATLGNTTYVVTYEHGTMVDKQETTMTKAQFVTWATNKGYTTECP